MELNIPFRPASRALPSRRAPSRDPAIVNVYVGADFTLHVVPKHVLLEHSTLFQSAYQSVTAEAAQNLFTFDDISNATFLLFLKSLYTNNITLKSSNIGPHLLEVYSNVDDGIFFDAEELNRHDTLPKKFLLEAMVVMSQKLHWGLGEPAASVGWNGLCYCHDTLDMPDEKRRRALVQEGRWKNQELES